ncbi:Protease inhibitor [Pseudolycoriella hygida]|uniref:Protease inhibitor n=1 Tax=Pseudolycoriella hygida TaxID=35572 RepID=A0A9Q0RVR4_9DIPT|nr:Protease inhibitor [Pseudolycoriella hygida]
MKNNHLKSEFVIHLSFFQFIPMFNLYIFATFLIVASGCKNVCTPGHFYYDGCNTCTCLQGGQGYGCTKIGCLDNPITCYVKSKSPTCVKGHFYNDGCNECICVDGKGYVCTEKACTNNPVVCYVQ